jgi:uncharacterized protein YdeI (YjbR/CyaY-like superfamily)
VKRERDPVTEMKDGLPFLEFADAEAFDRWLAANISSRGLWVKFAKKRGGAATLTKAEAIDCALCHGWIDGQLGRLDDNYFLTRFTPRKASGRWSANNRKRASELVAEGRMRPRGLAEIEAAKSDGRWQAAYPSATAAKTPPDFAAALAGSPKAAAFFAALDGANRYALMYRLHHAKPELRERRIAEFIAMLERGETFHGPTKAPPRQRGSSTANKRGAGGNSTSS